MESKRELAFAADKTAIGLSFICAVHCLLLPIIIALLPALPLLALEDEWFHRVLLVIVLPVSVFALLSGVRKHKSNSVLIIGVGGLLVLVIAAIAGHELFGETGERLVTVFGSFLVATSHFRNFRLCRSGFSRPVRSEAH